jgi:hypothetical protein
MADFATVPELETFMGTSGLGGRGLAMIGYASAAIRRYCQQDLEVTTGRQESWAGDAWRVFIGLTQRPVTAVSAITIDGVAFTDFTWSRWGQVNRNDFAPWSTGPILITYDSGYPASSDEMAQVKAITLEVAARAIGGNPETFGTEISEFRGPTPAIFLDRSEQRDLDNFAGVAMA